MAITGHEGEKFDKRAMSSGMDMILHKPPNENKIKQLLIQK